MLSVRTELRYQCKQTVASTLITAPIVKTPLPAAKLLKRQLLVFPQVTTRVSQEATKACRKRNAKGLPQPRPTTVTNWQHHESHPPFHLRLPEPKGACKERWIPWIMVMWNVFIVMCKDVEFTIQPYIYIYISNDLHIQPYISRFFDHQGLEIFVLKLLALPPGEPGCCHLQLLKDGHSSSPFLGSFT